MPLLRSKSKSGYVKIYRPNGTPHAPGHGLTVALAISQALGAFALEFGHTPAQRDLIIEVVGADTGYLATVLELTADERH